MLWGEIDQVVLDVTREEAGDDAVAHFISQVPILRRVAQTYAFDGLVRGARAYEIAARRRRRRAPTRWWA